MDLSTQLNHYMGLKNQISILQEEEQSISNEIEALFNGISSKLLQQKEVSSFEECTSFKYDIKAGYNVLNIGIKFYSFQIDIREFILYNLQEIEPIKFP